MAKRKKGADDTTEGPKPAFPPVTTEQPNTEGSTFPFRDEKWRTMILNALRLHGITSVIVSFDGSGDSGSVEGVQFFVGASEVPGDKLELIKIPYPEKQGTTYQNGQHKEIIDESEKPLNKVLEAVCYDCTEAGEGDWVNNEGGYGTMEIDLTQNPAKVTLDINYRITEVENHKYEF